MSQNFWSLFVAIVLSLAGSIVAGRELHVSVNGSDSGNGSPSHPFKNISAAAEMAQPGDVITVHEGVYREWVNPPRGGESDTKRIVYRAAPGERVEIKGSEIVKNWTHLDGELWKVALPNSFFGSFNPYADVIHGDWFSPKGRAHHTGAVYLNGNWLIEAANLEDVEKPTGVTPLWFAKVDDKTTTIWAQFKGVDPNRELVETNVRRAVFYPDKPGRNYITVRGFILRQAATPWAPPTAEQVGLIGPHWSRGWIIEDNTISHSTCCGISLGKYGDQFDNTSANTAEGYVKTIERALADGWNVDTVGHHVVRNNVISDCEQAGIVGSLGCSFSSITGNTIHDIHVRRLFSGAEMAGIKFHGAVDVEISHNHIYRTCLGVWLDWMAQGTHVTRNLLHDNDQDLFVEVNHGPFIVDNNIFLSPRALLVNSQGGAYVHNLMTGTVSVMHTERRQTPYLRPHSTEVMGLRDNPSGDDRFYNNLMIGKASLTAYDHARLPVFMDGNVFASGAKPSVHEPVALVAPDFDTAIKLVDSADGYYLRMNFDNVRLATRRCNTISSATLGKTAVTNLPYESGDGSPALFDTDYFGNSRNKAHPTPGPFEAPGTGPVSLKVW